MCHSAAKQLRLFLKSPLLIEVLANYRPTANLPFLSKILEKAAANQLCEISSQVSESIIAQRLHWSKLQMTFLVHQMRDFPLHWSC